METLHTYINGQWEKSSATNWIEVENPATKEILAKVPEGPREDVEKAVSAAAAAFKTWRNVPAHHRIQYLYKLKSLLEGNQEDLARTITIECGKTLEESRGELRRAIENVEMACGIPMMMQGAFSEDIARGVDEYMIRQPLGVCACITPFNFPGMIPFWFLPYAIACGNTFVVKPSEKVPITLNKVFQLLDQLDLPPGVVNMIHGSKPSVDALIQHPEVKAISFVGSSDVARYVYAQGATYGKRVQAQGGAKNPLIILPDADLDSTLKIVSDSVYGCAGQRCLAASTVVSIGKNTAFTEGLIEVVSGRTTGYGLDPTVQMGAIITEASRNRIAGLIDLGIKEGAELVLDGRKKPIPGYERGNFLRPSILKGVPLQGKVAQTEIFGPVMSLVELEDMDQALDFINSNRYGNMACIFTQNGAYARKFRHDALAGNIGINVGVAAPMAEFPFSGWKESFFGDLHGQGKHAVEFFTQTKVVVERWLKDWTRKF